MAIRGLIPKTKRERDRRATAIQALTAITTADASDLATAQALANANKAKINQIIAALKA